MMHSSLMQSARGLARRPVFTLSAVLTLALGMAATITFFSLMDWLLLRPVPGVRDADRVVQLRFTIDGSSMGFDMLKIALSYPTFQDLAANVTSVRDIAAVAPTDVNLGADDERLAERVSGALVSAAYFDALGAGAARGRLLGGAETAPGAAPAAVISDAMWRERFGAHSDVIGRALRVGGQLFTIIGVGQKGFRGDALDRPIDVWLPMTEQGLAAVGLSALELSERNGSVVSYVLARAPVAGAGEALRGEVQRLMQRLAAEYPAVYTFQPTIAIDEGLGLAEPLRTDIRRHAATVTAFVVLVLLAACGNAAYMLLARSIERRHEIAVRRALGAGSFRLFRQLIGESALLAVAAAVLGSLLTLWAIDLLEGVRLMPLMPAVANLHFDTRVAAFAVALIVVTVAIFGAAPAWLTIAIDPAQSFRGGSAMRPRGQTRAHRFVVGAQIAVAMGLAVSALLMSRSLDNMRDTDLGFDPSGVLTLAVDLESQNYSPARASAFWTELIDRAAALPGVTHAAYARTLPLGSSITGARVWIEGRPVPEEGLPWIGGSAVGPDYFDAMRIRLIAGRSLRATGDSAAIVIDENLASLLWPDDDPARAVGRTVLYDRTRQRTVVGIAARVATRDPVQTRHPQWYTAANARGLNGFVVLRTATLPPATVALAARALLRDIDADVPAFDVMTMSERVGRALVDSRTFATLLTAFGLFAIALAFFGIYGLMSYAVTARIRELGLRRALGARGRSLIRLVLGDALSLAAVAILVGATIARAASGLIRSRLYGVTPGDPGSYGMIAAALMLFTALATAAPAIRAVRVDPGEALRHE